ncbi:tRNA (adenosine(37)-N6)-threonylcarbamoyltransferase complex ATPase subunit type 1 TsaE [Qipengyuania spongiae]|uniref:tRNA threonylcarbamoyladenosine biosynthesis protein TsaE n=1 Tax=Qipengyuania spongiae TaxID=2909673 RepID=A0ABY5SY85_9SPHN|nr:tRNA (adenosine(37)-N6)-threonylcarbamoyltransferase complex ATPase subunit type 1 TsaE [Qipengyuania spongiae]UVI39125.1 tRNA (adenosine(37)-N6)-threonylcarbamoyltransferase complex ATPase subunit type 1 TsaE [Qipengyuania spongiae]
MTIDLPDLVAMNSLGRRIAQVLAPGDVVALTGDLGAGKTTLARGIIAALGHGGEVPSPTFTIIETYDSLDPPLAHADFYRLDDPAEVAEIGLEDYRADAALIAEWPERAGGFGHEPACLSIRLEKRGEGRQAIVEPGAAWQSRWP